jgi:hypothetical protein
MNTTTINSTTSNTNTHNAGCSPCTPEAHQRAGCGKARPPIVVENIVRKPVKRFGIVYVSTPDAMRSYNAEIIKNSSIRLFGVTREQVRVQVSPVAVEWREVPYSITFAIGDLAVYDSYNLVYTGEIVAIGEKTVTIKARGEHLHRLDLHTFAWRNYDFDIDAIRRRNADERQYL